MTSSKYPYYLQTYTCKAGWLVKEMAVAPGQARKVGYFEFDGRHIILN